MFNTLNIKKLVYGSFLVFIGLYIFSVFMSPIEIDTLVKYRITEVQVRLLRVTILLPIIAIWGCAAYGFVHFKQYALSIRGTPYGVGTNTIANSLGILVLQLLLSSGFSALSSIATIHAALGGDRGITIISTILETGLALMVALFLYRGAGQLVMSISVRASIKIFTKSFFALAAISVAYFASIVVQFADGFSAESIYSYVPLGGALIVIALPHILTWNIALLALKRLHYYRRHAKGKIYKQAFGLLNTGLLMIVGSTVLTQLLGTFGDLFANLELLPILIILYVLIFAIGIGYLFIAKSAKRLRRVEN